MLNYLNAVKLFGKIYDWNTVATIFCLIIVQLVLIVCAVLVIVFIIHNRTEKRKQKLERSQAAETDEDVEADERAETDEEAEADERAETDEEVEAVDEPTDAES